MSCLYLQKMLKYYVRSLSFGKKIVLNSLNND